MIVLMALALDLAAGEPRNACHPVAWVGALLGRAYGAAPRRGRLPPLLWGGAVVVAVAGGVAWLMRLAEIGLEPRGWAGLLAQAWLLKCSLSLRGLWTAGRRVEHLLAQGDLAAARAQVGRDLVSRRTDELGPAAVAAATVESVAENLTDSVVAPLLFYLLFGLPGAWLYRVVNTADAMVGYRGGQLEYLGKIAARLDDALNLVPARLAALALVLGSAMAGGDPRAAARTMRREHARTASPNAGWTMAAMAGALGVALEKPGAYRLGEGSLPGAADIRRSLAITGAAAALAGVAASAIAVAIR
jgi:adenosylcobinamide-phosphate synthase